MEEIICPHCGRPNLIEAEKCWYCQTILEKNTSEGQEKTSAVPKVNSDKIEIEANPNEEMQIDQNIPGWLKHVRELKKADQPPEEKDPNWQQQDLFVPEEKPQKRKIRRKKQSSLKEKTTHHNIKSKKVDDQLLRTGVKKRPKQTNDTDTQEKHAIEKLDKNSETLSDELPEGFTKL